MAERTQKATRGNNTQANKHIHDALWAPISISTDNQVRTYSDVAHDQPIQM